MSESVKVVLRNGLESGAAVSLQVASTSSNQFVQVRVGEQDDHDHDASEQSSIIPQYQSQETASEVGEGGDPDRNGVSKSHPPPDISLLFLLLFSGSAIGLLLCVTLLGIVFGVPIALIAVGSLHLGIEECFEEQIPILLIVGGVLSILSLLTRASLWGTDNKVIPFLHGMITLIDCVWMVVFSIFIYRSWPVVELDDSDSEYYCNKSLFLFSFGYITACWVIFAATMLYALCTLLSGKIQCLMGTSGGDN